MIRFILLLFIYYIYKRKVLNKLNIHQINKSTKQPIIALFLFFLVAVIIIIIVSHVS